MQVGRNDRCKEVRRDGFVERFHVLVVEEVVAHRRGPLRKRQDFAFDNMGQRQDFALSQRGAKARFFLKSTWGKGKVHKSTASQNISPKSILVINFSLKCDVCTAVGALSFTFEGG